MTFFVQENSNQGVIESLVYHVSSLSSRIAQSTWVSSEESNDHPGRDINSEIRGCSWRVKSILQSGSIATTKAQSMNRIDSNLFVTPLYIIWSHWYIFERIHENTSSACDGIICEDIFSEIWGIR